MKIDIKNFFKDQSFFRIIGFTFILLILISLIVFISLNPQPKQKSAKVSSDTQVTEQNNIEPMNNVSIISSDGEGLYLLQDGVLTSIFPDVFLRKNIIKVIYFGGSEYLVVTKCHGLYYTRDNFKTIQPYNSGLAEKNLTIENQSNTKTIYMKDIVDVLHDNKEPNKLFLAYYDSIYYSPNRGKHWELYLSPKSLSYKTITCINGNIGDEFNLLIGTPYSGILYQSSFNGTIKNINDESFLSEGNFTEQINSLFIDNFNTLMIGYSAKNILQYHKYYDNKIELLKNYNFPIEEISDIISTYNDVISISKNVSTSSSEKEYYFTTNDGVYKYSNGNWQKFFWETMHSKIKNLNVTSLLSIKDNNNYFSVEKLNYISSRFQLTHKSLFYQECLKKRCIYINPNYLTNQEEFYGIIKHAKDSGVNTIIYDFKDNKGNIYFPTEEKNAKSINAVQNTFPFIDYIDELKKNGFYIVGKISVYADNRIANSFDEKFAVKNSSNKLKWTDEKGNNWVDPYSDFITIYNIKLAEELVNLGVDEILFSNCYFPINGDTSTQIFDFNKQNVSKVEQIESFLIYAKKSITIPIGIELAGLVNWFKTESGGLELLMLTEHVDYIVPIFISSNITSDLISKQPKNETINTIYFNGLNRLKHIIRNKIVIRPFIFMQYFDAQNDNEGYDFNISKIVKSCHLADIQSYIFINQFNQYEYLPMKKK